MKKGVLVEEKRLRFAELLGIFVFKIARRSFVLLKSRWYPPRAHRIPTPQQQIIHIPLLRVDLKWENTLEDYIQAKDVHTQVALVKVIWIPENMRFVLDRKYDALM
jgi:hypothetical protein